VRKRIAAAMVAAALVGGIVASNVGAAQATDPITRLQRQVRVLQGKVANLQHEVFVCEELAPYQGYVTSTGQVWSDTFVDYSC
jgi:peptidoglycan hydrolase CwlO-like protein